MICISDNSVTLSKRSVIQTNRKGEYWIEDKRNPNTG